MTKSLSERLRNNWETIDDPIDARMKEAAAEIDRLNAEIARKDAALKRVLEIFECDALKGAFQMAAIHGYEYRGPTLTSDEIRAALQPAKGE